MASNVKKITNKAKVFFCYSLCGLADAGFYQYVTTFQLIFLTSVVGVSPVTAGTITSLSILLEAICCFVVGRISDNLRSRYGRRRPFLLISVFFMPLTVIACFVTLNQHSWIQFVYYILTGALFWVSYSVFYIPYTALGAEIAVDYDDRTRLRSVTRIFSISGTFLANVCPLLAIGFFMNYGMAEEHSWLLFSAIMSIIIAAGIFLSWNYTRGTEKEFIDNGQKKESFFLVFKDFYQLIKLKSMAILIALKLIYMFGFTLYTSGMMFFLAYRIGLDGSLTSSVYLISIVVSVFYTPLISFIALKSGKKSLVLGSLCLSGIAGLGLYILGVDNYLLAVLYVAVYTYGQSAFWQIINAMFYDVAEVDEYINGKRREGEIIAFQSIVGTFCASLGMQAIGILLKIAGFNADLTVQSESSLTMLENIFVLYPSSVSIVAALLLIAYPVTKKRFVSLQKALALKSEGKSYDIYLDDIKKLN